MLQLFRKKSKAPDLTPSTEGRTVYAVGDVHGRLDLLDALLAVIRKDAAAAKARPILVFLGDYVDRGPDSRGVVDRVAELKATTEFETVALMGNHERALLNFLTDPPAYRQWLAYGGRETLQSYGAAPLTASAPDDELIDCAAKFESLVAPRLDFLRSLKLWHVVGNHLFVHAGVRPNVALADQSDSDFLWIRTPFLTTDRHGLPYRVVHGHTPAAIVKVSADRISLDTGAYASGVLSAAKIVDREVDVLDTSPF